MKKKILVLDAHTNGHEAAKVFARRQEWSEADCEIVFCKTHSNVLQALIEGEAYAVVPIKNSTPSVGSITEVVETLDALREMGYDIQEQDRLDLPIVHLLLAPQYVFQVEDLDYVMSHEKAFQQCERYLDAVGVTQDRRRKCASTGGAAKAVAQLNIGAKAGAIASRVAAQEYGLRVLAEGIQDASDNTTTFLLLKNEARVKKVVVGIIGIRGRFGRMLEAFFRRLGCWVIGSDEKAPTGMSNTYVVQHADVVIFAVPIKDTPTVIRSVLALIRPEQLLMDVTSVKQPAVEAMLESPAQVVGLHPMFRPESPFDGQTVVVCPARLTTPEWKTWVVNVLAATRAHIKWSTPAEHDAHMTTVQVVPHLANLTSALLITEAEMSVAESLTYASPFYRIMLSLMGRLISQSPDLYASIVMENPRTLDMLERRIAIEQRLAETIRARDQDAFEGLFAQARQHFGGEVIAESNELFMRILGVLSTLYGGNSVVLEFSSAQNRPGLLEKISRVFSARQINLTGIHSVALDEHRLQFVISIEQSRSSDEVRRALEEIENWPDMNVKVMQC